MLDKEGFVLIKNFFDPNKILLRQIILCLKRKKLNGDMQKFITIYL